MTTETEEKAETPESIKQSVTEHLAEVKAKESADSLVEIEFTNVRGDTVTRKVYPEIAKFVQARKAAEIELDNDRRRIRRAQQTYVWQKEDEWLAQHGDTSNFNEYETQREYQRLHPNDIQRAAEQRYWRFVNAEYRGHGTREGEQLNSWAQLRTDAEAAGHATIVWIIDNCMDNEHEAGILLHYMPASVDELWTIAKGDHDMCGVFDRYMERAERAGIFKDEDLPLAVREYHAMSNWVRRTWGQRYVRDAMTQVKRVVRVERETALADARAQWDRELLAKYAESQDMRELLRSLAQDGHGTIQTYLNRSDGARRAAETRRRNQEQAEATMDRLSDEIRIPDNGPDNIAF